MYMYTYMYLQLYYYCNLSFADRWWEQTSAEYFLHLISVKQSLHAAMCNVFTGFCFRSIYRSSRKLSCIFCVCQMLFSTMRCVTCKVYTYCTVFSRSKLSYSMLQYTVTFIIVSGPPKHQFSPDLIHHPLLSFVS